jgi:hypothetical protein
VVVASKAKDTLATTTERSRGTPRVLEPDGSPVYSVVALLAEEPAGKIPTVSAGVARVEAALSCRPGDAPPPVPRLPEPPPGAVFIPAWGGDPTSATYRFSCEVRALRAAALAAALEGILRAVTARAALADVVLEARAIRSVDPVVYPASLVERLARDLWEAGIRVSFGPSWVPNLDAGLAVGSGGSEGEIEGFLRDHPVWRAASPYCASGRRSTFLAGALDQRRASG